jgi:hypothetical protein
VDTPDDNRTQGLFGAVNSRTGQTHVLPRPHKRSVDFQTCVDHVLIPAYPEADFLFLIVDGSSIYTSQSTRQWLAQRPQIVLVPLPSYAPHLNRQGQTWRWMWAEVTHNHFFGTCAALITAAESFFAKVDGPAPCGLAAHRSRLPESAGASSCSHSVNHMRSP